VRQKAGRINAAGMTKEVVFEQADDGAMNDRIDEACPRTTIQSYNRHCAGILS
jgi:hypothetical protein